MGTKAVILFMKDGKIYHKLLWRQYDGYQSVTGKNIIECLKKMDIIDDLRITISKLSRKLRGDDGPVDPAQVQALAKLTDSYTALLKQMGGDDEPNGSGRSPEAEAMLQRMRRRK